MNEVISTGNSFSELQAIINQAMAKQGEQLYKQVLELKENQEQLAQEIQITKMEHENLRELELKRHYTEEDRFGYVSQSDLGQKFDVSIGSKTMGRLLRLVGLAKSKQSKTEPMRTAIVNEFAKSVLYGDWPTYQWNPEKCIKHINRWLDAKNLLEEFYSKSDEAELEAYIKELEKTYQV